MAVMTKEQKAIDRLGPIGIVREAFKLFATYFKFFMMVQFTLMLPLAVILTMAIEFMIYTNLPAAGQIPQGAHGNARIPHLQSTFSLGTLPGGAAAQLQLGLAMVIAVLIWAVMTIVGNLSSCAIIYAVGLHYTGQSVSFMDVLHAAIPRLWMRLTVTKIYRVLLLYAMLIVQAAGTLLLVQYHVALPIALLGIAALGLLSIIGAVCIDIVFTLAAGVCVLEKDYGWAAVRRTPKLLKGRVIVALLFQLLLLVPAVTLLGFQRVFRYEIAKGDYSLWSVTAFGLGTVVHILCVSFFWQLQALCCGVQYASFKAYHNEDLAESIFEKQAVKAGYERIGSNIDDAKLGGPNAELLV
ncbi:unnamed protein product [Calypogeia fissa]